jgi:hypothetical protein
MLRYELERAGAGSNFYLMLYVDRGHFNLKKNRFNEFSSD